MKSLKKNSTKQPLKVAAYDKQKELLKKLAKRIELMEIKRTLINNELIGLRIRYQRLTRKGK